MSTDTHQHRPPPTRRIATEVVEVVPATRDTHIVRLCPAEGQSFPFLAGQYAKVTFPGCPPRDYSMAARPDRGFLEFHIREVAGGAASAHVARTLKPGDPVMLDGPYGSAYLREDRDGPIVAIAAATGLAPVKAIVERALYLGFRQPIHVFLGVRDEPDIYLEGYFRDLARRHPNLGFVPVLSEPRQPSERPVGLVGEVAAASLDDLTGATLYLAGSPAMVESAAALFLQRGVARADIHADAFYDAPHQRASGRP